MDLIYKIRKVQEVLTIKMIQAMTYVCSMKKRDIQWPFGADVETCFQS